MTVQTVDDEHFFEGGGPAFLVRPSGGPIVGGVLWLHWFDPEAPDGTATASPWRRSGSSMPGTIRFSSCLSKAHCSATVPRRTTGRPSTRRGGANSPSVN